MKRIEIDKIFARMLGEYLAKGYVVNTNTMGGHQGEVAKVDLRKGDDVLRMSLDKGRDWKADADWYVLTVGRATEPVRKEDGAIIWTERCDEIERHVFYQIGKDWFSGIEAYTKDCVQKRHARWKNGWSHVDPLTNDRDLPDSCRKVALGILRKMDRCHSVKLCDIKKVRRVRYYDGSVRFVADVRNKSVVIGAVKCA